MRYDVGKELVEARFQPDSWRQQNIGTPVPKISKRVRLGFGYINSHHVYHRTEGQARWDFLRFAKISESCYDISDGIEVILFTLVLHRGEVVEYAKRCLG